MAWGSLVAESMSLLGHGEGFGGSSIRTLSSREAENLRQYFPTVHCYHEWENQFLDYCQFFFRKKRERDKISEYITGSKRKYQFTKFCFRIHVL